MTVFLAALTALAASSPRAEDLPFTSVPKAVFLHYRWHKDGSFTLVSQRTEAVRLKPSRSEANRRAQEGLPGTVTDAGVPGGRRNPALRTALGGGAVALSYAVISAAGDTLYEAGLPDPRIRRVEYAVKGEPGLRSHTVVEDSGDVYLRIAEPEARTLKFFRWKSLSPASSLAKSGSASPMAAPVKTPLAEFNLP